MENCHDERFSKFSPICSRKVENWKNKWKNTLENSAAMLITSSTGGIKQCAGEARVITFEEKTEPIPTCDFANRGHGIAHAVFIKHQFRCMIAFSLLTSTQVVRFSARALCDSPHRSFSSLSTLLCRRNASFPPFPQFSTEQTYQGKRYSPNA